MNGRHPGLTSLTEAALPDGGHSAQVLPEAVTGGRGVGTVVPELSAEPGLCQGLFTWMEGLMDGLVRS